MKEVELVHKEDAYQIIGACMEVHKELGRGHSENIYKDALEIEFKRQNIDYAREMQFDVVYKENVLPHYYFADFVVFDTIILEVKAIEMLTPSHTKQTLNYLAASKLRLGILVNFGQDSLVTKRVVL